MTRLPATRTLTTALLGGLLALGSIAPAFAQQQDEQDRHERRDARRQQRNEDGQPKPQARTEAPRQQEARSRDEAPRHEHWGEATQQRDAQRREAMDLQAQARQREAAAARETAQRDAQRTREWQSRDAALGRAEARREQISEQARQREEMSERTAARRARDAGERQAQERRQREQMGASERAVRDARDREASRDQYRDGRRGEWQADRSDRDDRSNPRPGEPGRVDGDEALAGSREIGGVGCAPVAFEMSAAHHDRRRVGELRAGSRLAGRGDRGVVLLLVVELARPRERVLGRGPHDQHCREQHTGAHRDHERHQISAHRPDAQAWSREPAGVRPRSTNVVTAAQELHTEVTNA